MSKNLFGISDQLINDVKSVLGEKLTGGQKNLDVDKDGKIEASDFKKLRNKKLAAKMKKPEAGETAAHEKKEHSGPCSDDCSCMKEETEAAVKPKINITKSRAGHYTVTASHDGHKGKVGMLSNVQRARNSIPAAIEDLNNERVKNGYKKIKFAAEEVELGEGDPIVRTKSFPGEPPEGTYADMRRKGTLPKPIQAKDENDTPPWSGPSKKVPVGTVPSKSHRQKLARSGIPMKEDAIEESKQYIEVVDVSGQKKKVAVEAGKAFAALTHYRKQPNTKSARIVSEGAMMDHLFKVKHKHLETGKTKEAHIRAQDAAEARNAIEGHYGHSKQDWKYLGTKQVAEEADLEEKHLTPAEMKKREEIAKAMERENPKMPMGKKMAIATATAKKVAEEVELDEGDDASKDALAMKINAKNAKRKYADKALKMFRNELVRKKEERLNKEEYSIDEARGRPKKVKPGEEAADNEGDDTGSIVMKLRKASSIGKPVQFKDNSTHNISKSDARKALAKHDALRTSIEKEKLADRMHASHASFKDVLAGKGEPEEMTLMQKIKAARAARQ